jgi:hypothetical protein
LCRTFPDCDKYREARVDEKKRTIPPVPDSSSPQIQKKPTDLPDLSGAHAEYLAREAHP